MSSARKAGLIISPIISRAWARRDKWGQRNLGTATCGMTCGRVEAVPAYAIPTSLMRKRAAHRLRLACATLLAVVTTGRWITLRGRGRGKTIDEQPPCPGAVNTWKRVSRLGSREDHRNQPARLTHGNGCCRPADQRSS